MINNQPSLLFRFLRAITPPLIFQPIIHLLNRSKAQLFDEEENAIIFKRNIPICSIYAEYGCGLSTQYVLDNYNAIVLSVDSSYEWVEKVRKLSNNSSRLNIKYANVGKIGDWGRPISCENQANFSEYTDWIWKQTLKPDTVLIDGRFRVACFLPCLLNALEGTKIIFDDYTNRPEYHISEDFLSVTESRGRQALFITKELTDSEKKIFKLFLKNFVMLWIK